MGSLSFEPLIPLALWLSLAVAGLALLGWYARTRPAAVPRRRWLVIRSLMALGLVLLLLIVLNPTWVEPVTPPAGKPLLTVLVDATASMDTPDAADGQTRYRAAARLARACAEEMADRFEVRVRTFAGTLSPAEGPELEARKPDGQLTDLAAALLSSLEEGRPQGQAILLLSDGIHNAGGGAARVLDAVRVAKAMACPVSTRAFGGDVAAVKDLAVELRSPQELAYVGQKIPVAVLLRQRGLAGAQATLTLRHEDKEVERRQVALAAQETTEVRFQVSRDRTGLYRYEVRADPLPGEVSLVNNAATLLLRVVNDPVRVLLLEGKPYWDAKFLVRTLLLDPSLELDSVVRVKDGRLHRRTLSRDRAAPGKSAADAAPGKGPGSLHEEWATLTGPPTILATAENLRAYQVVVLGRDAEVFLSEAGLAGLRNWIARDGGCLVCYRGQPMTPVNQRLGQLLPVRWAPIREARFRPRLTDRGRDLHWFPAAGAEAGDDAFAGLPSLATAARPEQPRPLATVLATAPSPAEADSPVVTYQPYGTGRVVVIEGSGMWRWAFLPPQQQQQEEVYRALWHSLLRWLASSADLLPGQKLALRSDKARFSTLEPATATLLLREEAAKAKVPAVELRGDGAGNAQTVTPVPMGDEPGTFRVVFGKLPEGRYQARVAGTEGDLTGSTAFDVRSFSEEQLDLKARPDLMARIAQGSGGVVLEAGTPREMLEQFRAHLDQGRPQRVRRVSAWDRWWVLAGVLAAWGAAWGVRRSAGLV
jgi:hypothetical protein